MNTDNEPARPRMPLETENLALQTTLRRTEELLKSKDTELAAKEEIITLLREKIARMEQASDTVDPPVSGRPKQKQTGRGQNKSHAPKSSWEQLKDWFFNA